MRPTYGKKESEQESENERWQDDFPSPRDESWFMAVLFPLTSDGLGMDF